MVITGTWKKTSKNDCGEKYPATIEFKQGGLFEAQAAENATIHPLWDVGTYKIAKTKINISTSNDAIISYDFTLQEKTLTIKDPEGCSIKFQRIL